MRAKRFPAFWRHSDICRQKIKNDADFFLFNTCCVREHAEARLYGNVGALKEHKSGKDNGIIAVCGCMKQQPEAAAKLMRRFPFVDMVFGTNSIHKLGTLLEETLLDGKRAFGVDERCFYCGRYTCQT